MRVSGYILLEKKTSDRKYQTWFDQVQTALTQIGMGGSIKSLVSDRALALVQLAVQGLGVQSRPDLFHGMRCLSRSIGARLGGQARSHQETITTSNQGNNCSSPEGKTDFCFPEPTASSSP